MNDLESNLVLSIFLMRFRNELIEYRKNASVDVATPGEILDFVVGSLERAIKRTKELQCL